MTTEERVLRALDLRRAADRERVDRLRLAVGSLLDVVEEMATAVSSDPAWVELVRQTFAGHRRELGFPRD